MTNVLLTGAGFSRNWGGWLASEVFEYIIGEPCVGPELRKNLWDGWNKNQNFEHVLSSIEHHTFSDKIMQKSIISEFKEALLSMFRKMNDGLFNSKFEPENKKSNIIHNFLSKFDYIFTLNQDLLLEEHYNFDTLSSINPKFNGWEMPGLIKSSVSDSSIDANKRARINWEQDVNRFHISKYQQPYIKLHGSSNWIGNDNSPLLVLGGSKSDKISNDPLLNWYHEIFHDALHEKDTNLIIIGYGFGDAHINNIIRSASYQERLKIFIIDPVGTDIIKNATWFQNYPPQHPPLPTHELIYPCIFGASRRRLVDILSFDFVEKTKIDRFLHK